MDQFMPSHETSDSGKPSWVGAAECWSSLGRSYWRYLQINIFDVILIHVNFGKWDKKKKSSQSKENIKIITKLIIFLKRKTELMWIKLKFNFENFQMWILTLVFLFPLASSASCVSHERILSLVFLKIVQYSPINGHLKGIRLNIMT